MSDPLRELLTRADSYLSLLWHRYVPPDRKSDFELQREVERTIGDLRTATKGFAESRTRPSQDESAERTLRSIAAMLGWMNVPPRETLEADIRALKARAGAIPRPSPPTGDDLRLVCRFARGFSKSPHSDVGEAITRLLSTVDRPSPPEHEHGQDNSCALGAPDVVPSTGSSRLPRGDSHDG